MISILIATDFSEESRNASFYGFLLGRELNARMILFNAYKIPQAVPSPSLAISRYDRRIGIQERLEDEAYFLDPRRKLIDVECEEGLAADTIVKIANEKKVDFIVTGMKGSGKNFKKIFGSTATSLARKTNIPLIIVPQNVRYKTPKIMVLASDAILENKNLPANIDKVTRLFKPKLYVVEVVKNKNEEYFQYSKNNENDDRIFQLIDASAGYPVNTNIGHALNEFVERHQADILIMMPHKHEWLERILRRNETKKMIFNTQIPLMILPEDEVQNSILKKKEVSLQTEKDA